MSEPGTATFEAHGGEERILDWEGCLNARDTGGLPTRDGGRTRNGALIRSDVLTGMTPGARVALVDHGVRTIVDLRTSHEIARDWDSYPFRDGAEESVQYRHVCFSDGGDERAWEEAKERYRRARTRAELNCLDLDTHAAGIGRIVATVADAPPGGVLVHCHAGKDRTGIVVALLLAISGVSADDIADDYALSFRNLEPLMIDWLVEMGGDEAEQRRLRDLAEPRREAMLDTLAYLDERYGGPEQYLFANGVSRDQLDRIRERLCES